MANTVELFTLRLWQEGPSDQTEWRGKIQHVRSGETRYFRDWYTLVVFLSDLVPKLDTSNLGSGNFPGGHGSSGHGSSEAKPARRAGKSRSRQISPRNLYARWQQAADVLGAQLALVSHRVAQAVVKRWRLALLMTQAWAMSLAASLVLPSTPASLAFVVVDI